MRLSASLKFLLGIGLAVWATGQSAAQEPDYLPLQPDKVEWADQVGRHAKVRKDSNLLAEYHYLYGKIYEASRNFLMAKRHYFQSLRIQEARGYAYAQVRLYCRMAVIENDQLHFGEAFRYARLGLRIAEQSNDDQARLMAYNYMYELYSGVNNREGVILATDIPRPSCDSLLHYLRKQEPVVRRIEKPLEIIGLNSRLGRELLRRKDRSAIAYLKEALDGCIELEKPHEQVAMMLDLGWAYLVFEQPEEAFVFIQRAKKLHDTLSPDNKVIVQGFESIYARYYSMAGNWKAALEHTLKLHELQQQNHIADHHGAVTRLGMEFENEKKEAQLASQRKELALKNENLRTQRWFLLSVTALLLLSVWAIAFYYRLFRQKARISRQNAELVQEQNHRVKNNLQVVSGLLQLQANRLSDAAAIAALEDTQSRLKVMAALQKKLYENDRLTPIKAADFVQELVDMALLSFGCSPIVPHYEIPETIELPLDYALPVGLIVNELTTNACKYAFADHADPELTVRMWMEGSALHLLLADNGGGFKPPSPGRGGRQSLGMKIIDLQVKQLKGKSSFDTTEGTTFQMHFEV
jgi:two-component sensor histidine kinase